MSPAPAPGHSVQGREWAQDQEMGSGTRIPALVPCPEAVGSWDCEWPCSPLGAGEQRKQLPGERRKQMPRAADGGEVF